MSKEQKALNYRIAIVYGEWYPDITKRMRAAAVKTLKERLREHSIEQHAVPGAYEIPLMAQHLADNPVR